MLQVYTIVSVCVYIPCLQYPLCYFLLTLFVIWEIIVPFKFINILVPGDLLPGFGEVKIGIQLSSHL